MTTETLLRQIRELVGAVDIEASDLTDLEILEYVHTALDILLARGVLSDDAGYAVGLEATDDDTYGVVPDPTLIDGRLLALQTAVSLLGATYRGRLDRGELGTSWVSGLESESTISAEKAYSAGINAVAAELQSTIAIRLALSAGFRAQ